MSGQSEMVEFVKGDGDTVHVMPSTVASVEPLHEDPEAQTLIHLIGGVACIRVRENHKAVVRKLAGGTGMQTRSGPGGPDEQETE